MATNRSDNGDDYQSRSDAYQEQEKEKRSQEEYNREQDQVSDYLKHHPSASYAEARYNRNR